MKYTFADKVLDSFDGVLKGLRGWVKADHTQYFGIACADSSHSLALDNGSLISVLEIQGYMGQYVPDAFNSLREKWVRFFQTMSADPSFKGLDLFWSYEYDPEGMLDYMRKARQPMLQASKRRGIDIEDIVDEEINVYSQKCASEKQYLIIATNIDALPKADHKKAQSERLARIRSTLRGSAAMLTGLGLPALRVSHEQHVAKVITFLADAGSGYSFSRLDAYQSLWSMRHCLTPGTTSKAWKARLTLRDTGLRKTDEVNIRDQTVDLPADLKNADMSVILPPLLSDQMLPHSIVDIGNYSVVGDRTYAPMYVDELAVDPEPLEHLLRGLYRHRIPARLVFNMGSNWDQANYWNRTFASTFNWVSSSNRQIYAASNAMQKYSESNGSVLAFGISITTWAKTEVEYNDKGNATYRVSSVAQRARDLEALLQQWGGQQISSLHGCSVEATMSATPGYMIPMTCPLAPQIEHDVITQLPIMRPAKLWAPEHAIWFRTSDGALMPYQPMSTRQNTMINLVVGGMGYGKSNFISESIEFFATHPEVDQMPYIRGMDFGASSSGVIDIIRSALPENRKHEAIFEFFTNDGSLVKNMLDTPLGCRYPLGDHMTFLINWLMTLADDVVSNVGGVSTITAILKSAVARAYKRKDPDVEGSEPNVFTPAGKPAIIHEWIEKLSFPIDENTYWWDLVEAFATYGVSHNDSQAIYAARVAQRYAVPMLFDIAIACTSVADEYKTAPTLDGIPLTDALTNSLKNANQLFACFNGVTNRDISESRICVFDMSNVFQRGDGAGAEWERSVFFMTALRLLSEDLFVSKAETWGEMIKRKEELGLTGGMGPILDWHGKYLERQDQIMKVFLGDELHRIGKVSGAFSTLEQMGMEGRKYRVGLLLGTQVPEHLPKTLLKLFSSAFIFGASQSSENATSIKETFDLSDDERETVLGITKPNADSGAQVFCIHKVDTRIQKVKLHLNLGPLKRWAYATEANERALRAKMYALCKSTAEARKVLAANVPDLNKEMARRKEKIAGSGNESVSESEVINMIVDDLLDTRAKKC